MATAYCRACGAKVSDRFCGHCGTPVTGPLRRPKTTGNPWMLAGFVALSALALVAIVLRQPEGSGITAAPATAPGAPPDISGLGPRQRFDTLFNVVMRASENGDASRATRFVPMAFMAYAQLEAVDADARYHAAVMRLEVEGNIQPALALADWCSVVSPASDRAADSRSSADCGGVAACSRSIRS